MRVCALILYGLGTEIFYLSKTSNITWKCYLSKSTKVSASKYTCRLVKVQKVKVIIQNGPLQIIEL